MNAWIRFCQHMGLNEHLVEDGVAYSEDQTEVCILAFSAFEITRAMSTFNVYLPGIRSFFVERGIKNNFARALHSESVKFVKRGYIKIQAKLFPADGVKKLAFTLGLVNFVKETMNEGSKNDRDIWEILSQEIALRFGIYFLLRKSEYLPDARKFGLQRSNIMFFSMDGTFTKSFYSEDKSGQDR